MLTKKTVRLIRVVVDINIMNNDIFYICGAMSCNQTHKRKSAADCITATILILLYIIII